MIEIKIYTKPQHYKVISKKMVNLHKKIASGEANETIWMFEHYPVYTIGTSGDIKDILNRDTDADIIESTRGGQVTWHGEGQRVVWLMINLKKRKLFIKEFVASIQDWIISALQQLRQNHNLNITFHKHSDYIGVWAILTNNDSFRKLQFKVAAIGFRVSAGITLHGVAINVNPDLSYYNNIIPCGICDDDLKVGSLHELGIKTSFAELDQILIKKFSEVFNIKTKIVSDN